MTNRISNCTKRLLKRLGALTLVFAIATALLFISIPFLKSSLVYFFVTRPLDNQNASWREQQEAQDHVDELREKDDTFKWLDDSAATKTGVVVKRIMVVLSLVALIAGCAGYIFAGYVIWRDAPYFFRNSKLASNSKLTQK